MREFDPQCRFSRKEAVGMEYIFSMEKTQKEYVVPSISFQTFFVQAFKIVIDS